MRLVLTTALLLAASGVNRPGCGSTPAVAPPLPCALAPRDACTGKACGAECARSGCGPAGPGRCDAYGECVPSSGPPPTCGPSAACAGATCGAPCDRCDGTCATPVPGACDYAGWCAPADLPWLCDDPCAGKACGASCTECPPNPPTCFESDVAKACDGGGHCVAAWSMGACP